MHDDPPGTANATGNANALAKGTRLFEFEVESMLGAGGFAIVYLAFDHSLHRRIAIKEYLPVEFAFRHDANTVLMRSVQHKETFDAGLKSFVQEARFLAQFEHPSLVKVHRVFEANGTAYMVQGFYAGATLRELLKAGQVYTSETDLRSLIVPLLDAVESLHMRQCLHRDIAPDNIIVQPNGVPVLLDFGAARRIIGDMTQALTAVLKPSYAPIEQYTEEGGLAQGAWTDVYGLAAVLRAAITGKPPPSAVGRTIRDSLLPFDQQPPAGYSMQFLRAIDAGLAVLPNVRPQSIAEFRTALGLDDVSIRGQKPPLARSPPAATAAPDATRVNAEQPDAAMPANPPSPPVAGDSPALDEPATQVASADDDSVTIPRTPTDWVSARRPVTNNAAATAALAAGMASAEAAAHPSSVTPPSPNMAMPAPKQPAPAQQVAPPAPPIAAPPIAGPTPAARVHLEHEPAGTELAPPSPPLEGRPDRSPGAVPGERRDPTITRQSAIADAKPAAIAQHAVGPAKTQATERTAPPDAAATPAAVPRGSPQQARNTARNAAIVTVLFVAAAVIPIAYINLAGESAQPGSAMVVTAPLAPKDKADETTPASAAAVAAPSPSGSAGPTAGIANPALSPAQRPNTAQAGGPAATGAAAGAPGTTPTPAKGAPTPPVTLPAVRELAAAPASAKPPAPDTGRVTALAPSPPTTSRAAGSAALATAAAASMPTPAAPPAAPPSMTMNTPASAAGPASSPPAAPPATSVSGTATTPPAVRGESVPIAAASKAAPAEPAKSASIAPEAAKGEIATSRAAVRRRVERIAGDAPVYPREAIRAGIDNGRIVALLQIDERGNVTDVAITTSLPPRVFDRAARAALQGWKFKAEGDKYVGEVEIDFKLKE